MRGGKGTSHFQNPRPPALVRYKAPVPVRTDTACSRFGMDAARHLEPRLCDPLVSDTITATKLPSSFQLPTCRHVVLVNAAVDGIVKPHELSKGKEIRGCRAVQIEKIQTHNAAA